MRYVVKPKGSCPSWLRTAAVKTELTAIARSGNITLIKEDIYAQPYKDSKGKRASHTRDVLNTFYFGKCAYCETHCRADVEHYRPKGGKKGADAHSGYPWLCYEWSNLVPGCADCNQRSGKRSKFPVAGTRVTMPHPTWRSRRIIQVTFLKADSPYLLAEAPLLLHPELDDPAAYLGFRPDPQRKGFEIYGLDAAGRGKETAEICYLNRQDLLSGRLDVLTEMRKSIRLLFQNYEAGRITDLDFPPSLKLLFEQWQADSHEVRAVHTLLRQFVLADAAYFDLLLVPLLEHAQQSVVSQYFQAYKTGQL